MASDLDTAKKGDSRLCAFALSFSLSLSFSFDSQSPCIEADAPGEIGFVFLMWEANPLFGALRRPKTARLVLPGASGTIHFPRFRCKAGRD